MQLYHHPYSLDSQKVRLALEERGIDYTSYQVNPLKARNMDATFFRLNPSAKLPVFRNGECVIYETLEIIRYIERIVESTQGFCEDSNQEKVEEWMKKIQAWSAKTFTLAHIPDKHRLFVSRFTRRVVIARMAESPDLASLYHMKLREAYETEEKLKDAALVRRSEEQLDHLLDEVERQLRETHFLCGDAFSMADAMFVPVLARIELLGLGEKYISCRPGIEEYWKVVKSRHSYRVVIGKFFSGWRKYKTLFSTFSIVFIRNVLKRY
ncbi:glutathione S-transferase TCHQD [Amborella trichopoda]|uniref:TCHQD class glutathione S-transferase n=1 Tax=Amborella trichopoda TaxID=13333 RepID=W1PM40_AMBTC|nr:glutathione S-transferase TCHQD [Amborella trichopoda]XP_011624371.1 glutathione S-transferase TCHQD [Amborella trichopoda]XP_020524540.1 glutathione S-transferase TCHQD [Amborella trichopoda]ERN08746.1 hypothetical protein AMTR_s00017p00243750 [Amborella trichopoda]|eukprot:XP_006847165.1 glutathione S-transferase TCHQD [Amborella trichopoda]